VSDSRLTSCANNDGMTMRYIQCPCFFRASFSGLPAKLVNSCLDTAFFILIVALSGLLVACSDGSGTIGGGGLAGANTQTVGSSASGVTDTGPSGNDASGTVAPVNGSSGAPITGDVGDCTYVLDSDITSATRLVNTANQCDYLITRWIEVRSLLEIEPGTVIRSNADERIRIEGGELRAIGTAEQRIVFEGITPVQGFWRGIDIDSARNVVMDYVDIKDAGQVCSTLFCPDVAFYVDNTKFSFTNSSLSNSYVHGMTISDGTLVEAFSNNRFFGNAFNGLNVPIEFVPMLDEASDYYGIERANGNPAVGILSGEQTSGNVFDWKALNAPYFVGGYFRVYGGILKLQPGVEIVFGNEAWMTIEDNGVIQALGTATEPVILRGGQALPGYWDGIRMSDTNFDTSVLQHTVISHSGNTDNLLSAFAGLRMDEAKITLRDASVIYDGGGNQFTNNASGSFPRNCSIQ